MIKAEEGEERDETERKRYSRGRKTFEIRKTGKKWVEGRGERREEEEEEEQRQFRR